MPNSEATKIAVLQDHQAQMTNDISEIKSDIREIKNLITTNFVTQTEYVSYKARMDSDLKLVKGASDKAIDEAKKSALLRTVGYCLITVVITCLVVFFFDNK